MKKIISVILVIALFAGLAIVPSAETEPYPESEHDYANNTQQTWTYKGSDSATGLYVTFSDDTYVEMRTYYHHLTDEIVSQEAMEAIAKDGWYAKGDSITINRNTYTGYELAGETVYVYGNKLEITLESDSSVTGYGFRITDIREETSEDGEDLPAGMATINYIIDGNTETEICRAGETIVMNKKYQNRHTGNNAIVGWKTEDGKEFYYRNGASIADFDFPYTESYSEEGFVYREYGKGYIVKIEEGDFYTYVYTEEYYDAYYAWLRGTDITAEAGKVYNLYPIYCKLGLTTEETFSFTNSTSVFNKDLDGYLYTRENFMHQFIDWGATFALSPLSLPAAVVTLFNTAFWSTSKFSGSCCGFPVTALLQHYGKIDILSDQGVENVSELKPDENIQSIINFYNNAATAAHLVNHWGINPGTKEYSRQLKAFYETVESGTPVYFEYYPSSSQHPMKTIKELLLPPYDESIDSVGAHGILASGAFTDNDGNHILLCWDNNSEEYSRGYADIFIINEDFTEITEIYSGCYGIALNGFSWNDDMSTFESFPAEGIPNPFAWHVQFIKHLFELLIHGISNAFSK